MSLSSSQTAEEIGNNIVRITDSKGSFYGTGFFVEIREGRYCITCHHCISRLNGIFIEKNDTRFTANWDEQYSDPHKDVAVLKTTERGNVKALNYAREAMARFPVSVWGFSFKDLEIFPQGSPVEDGILSSAPLLFNWPEEEVEGNSKWNIKPQIKVYVFRFSGKFDVGFSGAPVCYTGNYNIVGIFTAKAHNYGYVIPIQTILERFDQQKHTTQPSKTVDMSYYITRGLESSKKGDYDEAIKQYDVVLNNRNYFVDKFN